MPIINAIHRYKRLFFAIISPLVTFILIFSYVTSTGTAAQQPAQRASGTVNRSNLSLVVCDGCPSKTPTSTPAKTSTSTPTSTLTTATDTATNTPTNTPTG